MFALYLLLPLLASVTLAAPTKNQAELEPRQRRPGGGRGSRVRPGSTQVAATSAAAAPVAPAPSASASSVAPVAEVSASTALESPAPVSPATSAVPGTSDETTAADPTDAAGSGTDATAASSAPVASASEATSTGSSTGRDAAGSGPVGTGWDPLKNNASMDTYVDAGLQWWSNWSPSSKVEYPAIEFVPMVWGSGSVPELQAAMGGWPSSTKYVLSFNEPDMEKDGGSAMTVADGVKFHNEAVAILGDAYEVGTPAVADHPPGEEWLDGWLAACETAGGCKHDFIPIHFYGTDPAKLIAYAKRFSEKYKKPLWLTEWACHQFKPEVSCSAAEAEQFMKTVIEWLRGEGSTMVTRWSWFGAFPDMTDWYGYNMDGNRIANADGTINALGKEYMKL